MSEGISSEWGRIAPDGTVYLRTPEGEREIGSWQAGPPEEGLAYYTRRYDDTAAGIGVLEQRLAADADPREIAELAARARAELPNARILGDLAALDARLAAIVERAHGRREERRAARVEQRAKATAAKEALVVEAEGLAGSNDWKATGDRLRAIVTEWKAVRGADRAAEGELWQRYAAARDEFNRRRGEHFAALDKQRKTAQARKEALCAEAEALRESTEWGRTAGRYRELLAEWKTAGRAAKDVDDALWARFHRAQDEFFARRTAALAERDAELREHLAAKRALLTEAEALDPAADPAAAQKRMRAILERWAKVGRLPREAGNELDRRLEAAQQRIRDAAEQRWSARRDLSASPLVIRLRESIGKLEGQIERARARGDAAAAAEAEGKLATQRSWLAQADRR